MNLFTVRSGKGRRRRRLLLAFAVVAITIAPATIDVPVTAAAGPAAVVIVDGVRFNARPGLVLKRGIVDRMNGVSTDVGHQVEISVPKTIGYASVAVGVTETCALVIQDVVFETEHQLPDGSWLRGAAQVGPTLRERLAPGSIAYADTQHEIWGRHLTHEQFHVTTTLAHMGFTYWEGPASVYSPATKEAYCWRAGTGWTILNC